MKHDRKTIILTTLVCLIPVIAGIILYDSLPAEIAIHWDSQGNVNGTQSKFVGAIVFPGIFVLVNLLLPLLMRIDPKYDNMGDKLKGLVQWIIPLVSVIASGLTLGNTLGKNFPVATIAPMLVGLLVMMIGNYLPKTKQSYTLGIKLPWTLYSEDNWDKTHRMAGFLWVICGFIMIISCLLPIKNELFIVCSIIMLLVPTVYSYLYYRKSLNSKE